MHSFLHVAIFGAVILGAIETVDSISAKYATEMNRAEWLFVMVFAVDYVANIVTAPRKLAYILSFWGVIDLISILPSMLMMANVTSLKSLRILRVLRVMRVLRVLRLARGALIRIQTGRRDTNMFGMNLIIYAVALCSVVVISSSLEYYAEYTNGDIEAVAKVDEGTLRFFAGDLHGDLTDSKVVVSGSLKFGGTYRVKDWNVPAHQFDVAVEGNAIDMQGMNSEPVRFDAPSKSAVRWARDTTFTSVPQAMWWSVVTLTTVGYGDMYPVTVAGRLVACATMLCGLVLFGMLMGLVGKAMNVALFGTPHMEGHDDATDEQSTPVSRNKNHRYCPTCGRLHPQPKKQRHSG